MKSTVIAIFDIGKTNKKLLLFDESYRLVYEKSKTLEVAKDEDSFPCENLELLTAFVHESLDEVISNETYDLKAVNFSAYGASFVLLDKRGKPICPLYDYLKPYPEKLLHKFYDLYGGREAFSLSTASPVLGSLNSGMQLFRLKHERPHVFREVKYALHLPQFLAFIITGQPLCELTSVGCHTNLWNFQKNKYHHWVSLEGIEEKFPPIVRSHHAMSIQRNGHIIKVGVGLHDSSAALIPYLKTFPDPFVLISTGTWSISLNPFNNTRLTLSELERDCLCYLTFEGKPVKASRFFAGHEYDEQVSRIASYFHIDEKYFSTLNFEPELAAKSLRDFQKNSNKQFVDCDLASFDNERHAYHRLICDLVIKQKTSTALVMNGTKVDRIFVDGGFSKNRVFMNLMAWHFEEDVFAATMSQGTALGSAMAIHTSWNSRPIPESIISLKHFPKHEVSSIV